MELGPGYTAQGLLSLAISAKNNMHHVRGYSTDSNQWAFGQELATGICKDTTYVRRRTESRRKGKKTIFASGCKTAHFKSLTHTE